MSKIDLDAISDYVRRMEHTGSSPCYIETKQIRAMIEELKAARKVVEAVKAIEYDDDLCLSALSVIRAFDRYNEELEGREK